MKTTVNEELSSFISDRLVTAKVSFFHPIKKKTHKVDIWDLSDSSIQSSFNLKICAEENELSV